jgi:membrane protease YdiL (CAAX protease family)
MNESLKNKALHIRTSKKELFLQILLVFVLPIFLIKSGIIPIQMRTLALISIVFVLLLVLLKEKWTFAMLGLEKSTIKKYILFYAIFTALGVIIISQLGEKVGLEELSKWWKYKHFLYLFFIVSLFQEIAYRGYLIPALAKLTSSPLLIIVCNTLLFTLLHTIFPNLLLNLPLALIGGLGFSIMYIKYPNLPLMILSHSILNFVAVLYGFFIIPGVTY